MTAPASRRDRRKSDWITGDRIRSDRFAPVLQLLRDSLSESTTVWCGETGVVLDSGSPNLLTNADVLSAMVTVVASTGQVRLVAEVGSLGILAIPIALPEGARCVATAPFLIGELTLTSAAEIANCYGGGPEQWQSWAIGQSVWPADGLLRLGTAILAQVAAETRAQRAEQELDRVSENLTCANAEIRLLETITRKLRISGTKESELLQNIVRALVSAIDAKDRYTSGHSDRVARLAVRIALELRCNPTVIKTIYMAGLLHDVGKIGIDDQVLRKPESLTDSEFAHIQDHPELGYQILADLKQLSDVLPAVLHHHERWDGLGYPAQLAGDEIPRIARIMAVADAYDAMTSDRPYRPGMPEERVDQIFREGAGKSWDPEVVDALFKAKDDIRAISQRERTPASSSH